MDLSTLLDAAGAVIPFPFDTAAKMLRKLWTQYNDLGDVLRSAKTTASHFTSLTQLLQGIAQQPDLLPLVAPQADALNALLGSALDVTREAVAADKARHGSWCGWARAILSSAAADSAALERNIASLNAHLDHAVSGLGAAIGVQVFVAVKDQRAVVDRISGKLEGIQCMLERLTLALSQSHEAETTPVRKELAWLKGVAATGDPHSSMVSYALKSSQDLCAEVEAAALARFLARGAAANSLVLQAPILQLCDLAEWSAEGVQLVGAGTYGQVRRGVLAEFGLPVAVKTLPQAIVAKACESEAYLAHLVRGMRREADIQFTLRDHSGVATVYGILLDVKERVLGLVMELAEGSLHDALVDRQGHPDLPLPVRIALLEQVASALAVMHRRSPPMLHGDVKAANVLLKRGVPLGASGSALLTDFGMARVEADLTASTAYLTNSVRNEGVGTPLWKAPELFGRKKEQPSEASDTYAFGMLMFEVLTRTLPFEGEVFEDESSLVELLKEGGRPDTVPEGAFKSHVPLAVLRGPLVPLMQRCWDGDKAKRPSIAEVALELREELASNGGAVADAAPGALQGGGASGLGWGSGAMPSGGAGSPVGAQAVPAFSSIMAARVVSPPSPLPKAGAAGAGAGASAGDAGAGGAGAGGSKGMFDGLLGTSPPGARALCLGINDYRRTEWLPTLHGCANDATDIGRLLTAHSFDVEVKLNATGRQMFNAVETLIGKVRDGDKVVVLLSGHGGMYDSDNYLFPVDFGTTDDGVVLDLPKDALPIHAGIVTRLQKKNPRGLNFVIADMCRSPTRFRGEEDGRTRGLSDLFFSKPETGSGCLVAFACEQGHTSRDGGRNGLYTSVLLKHLEKPIHIEDMLAVVESQVREQCKSKSDPMRPWHNGSFFRKINETSQLPEPVVLIGTPKPQFPDAEQGRRESEHERAMAEVAAAKAAAEAAKAEAAAAAAAARQERASAEAALAALSAAREHQGREHASKLEVVQLPLAVGVSGGVGALPVLALPVQALPVQALPVQAVPVQAVPVQALPVGAGAGVARLVVGSLVHLVPGSSAPAWKCLGALADKRVGMLLVED